MCHEIFDHHIFINQPHHGSLISRITILAEIFIFYEISCIIRDEQNPAESRKLKASENSAVGITSRSQVTNIPEKINMHTAESGR